MEGCLKLPWQGLNDLQMKGFLPSKEIVGSEIFQL